jgi:hypothetical protein
VSEAHRPDDAPPAGGEDRAPGLGGDAEPNVPVGAPGGLTLVDSAPAGDRRGARMVFVLRNNTGAGVARIRASAEVRDPAGSVIARATTVDLLTDNAAPGGLIIGSAEFDTGGPLPADAELTVHGVSVPPDEPLPLPLAVVSTSLTSTDVGRRLDGVVRNDTDQRFSYGGRVVVACFDLGGALVTSWSTEVEFRSLAPGETATFTEPVEGTCETHLVGVSSWPDR